MHGLIGGCVQRFLHTARTWPFLRTTSLQLHPRERPVGPWTVDPQVQGMASPCVDVPRGGPHYPVPLLPAKPFRCGGEHTPRSCRSQAACPHRWEGLRPQLPTFCHQTLAVELANPNRGPWCWTRPWHLLHDTPWRLQSRRQTPVLPTYLPARTLRDGGQRGPGGGHIDTGELWGGVASEVGGATKP